MKSRKLASLLQDQIIVAVIAVLTVSCNLVSPEVQESTSNSGDIQSSNSSRKGLDTEINQDCANFKRALNPITEPVSPESNQDRSFRLAYSYAIEGDFDKATLNYHQAAELSSCDCDRLHAEAGEKATREAREVLKKGGLAARPTQFFWGRLQELTQTLPCVEVR